MLYFTGNPGRISYIAKRMQAAIIKMNIIISDITEPVPVHHPHHIIDQIDSLTLKKALKKTLKEALKEKLLRKSLRKSLRKHLKIISNRAEIPDVFHGRYIHCHVKKYRADDDLQQYKYRKCR